MKSIFGIILASLGVFLIGAPLIGLPLILIGRKMQEE